MVSSDGRSTPSDLSHGVIRPDDLFSHSSVPALRRLAVCEAPLVATFCSILCYRRNHKKKYKVVDGGRGV